MSWQALKWAWKQQAGGLARKAVLNALADHASERGRAYPTVETIASNIEANKKTVRLAIRHLLEDGLILDTGKRTGANGRVPIYQLSMPSLVQTKSILSPALVQTKSIQATKSGSQFIGATDPNPDVVSFSTTTTEENFEKLIAELKPLHPNINIQREFDNCRAWYRKHNNGTVTARRFRKWMQNAEPELKPPKLSTPKKLPLPDQSCTDPAKEADLRRQWAEWKAKGHPLHEFPESKTNNEN